MFRTAAPGRERSANSFTAAMTAWRESSDSWFDGTVGSVDHRLQRCAKLLGAANGAMANTPFADAGQYLAALQELSADRQAIASLRDDLLTGSSGREAVGVSRSPGRTAAKTAAIKLASSEKRWVELEGDRFFTANRDAAHDHEELSERARHHAERHTSALGMQRSAVVTQAFIDKVVGLGRATPKPRLAAAPRPTPDFAPEMLFLA
ncbi:hypothetical protein SEA_PHRAPPUCCINO_32 [Mycobacterium phage Phrappuccino]|uniref:Uncharacterized protein n=1 Tax=Mycobacterium phage Phrappuccino TaxID=2591223 RepID=A0A514DDN0_9CAUD|nr:hypothetical protein KHQ87_gp032 [Mycobacterium phage Phrappuccino]QDH91710.1 hypothetical protein SEA_PHRAPPUCCINO_32 [Mycobacterium phage Phrappuccino]QIQ63154.1 hypothetical protein SEA_SETTECANDELA_32 [Mycobacterium phage Settecandela]